MAAIRQGNVSAEGGKAVPFLKKLTKSFCALFSKSAGLSFVLYQATRWMRRRQWILSLTF
jgi:hypothetical protein